MEVQSHAEPFHHWQLSKALPADLMASIWVPRDNWPHWLRYSSAWESDKRTCNEWEKLPRAVNEALAMLARIGESFSKVIGLENATACLYGGGLHVTDPGGRLDTHLDYAVHPKLPGLERRLNLVLFLNECDGGRLQFWNDDATAIEAEYAPAPNTGVAWLASDLSYHSVSEVTGTTPRASLAVYFCCPARPEATRKRALWVPRRNT